MLRISTVDSRSERRLVVEGELTKPWVGELRKTWEEAGENLRGRKLVIDLSNATLIGREGKDTLLEMMQEGAKFSCSGVLTRYVLRQLAYRCQGSARQGGGQLNNRQTEQGGAC